MVLYSPEKVRLINVELSKAIILLSNYTLCSRVLFHGCKGVMLGLGCYKDLALLTTAGIATMVACLISPLGQRLDGILISLGAFCLMQSIGVVVFHLRYGPLARRTRNKPANAICDIPETS